MLKFWPWRSYYYYGGRDGEKDPVMRPNQAVKPGRLERDEQDQTATTGVAEQKIRTGQRYQQISDSHEGSAASTPSVGGTSMSTLDAVACTAEQANPANIYDLNGLWAPKGEKTSRDCGHFGEAVEPTVDPSHETHTCDEDGMSLIGWVTTHGTWRGEVLRHS